MNFEPCNTKSIWLAFFQGDRGLEGIPGRKGDRGEDGLFGIPGARGMAGNPGLDGLPGLRGYEGDRGGYLRPSIH